MTDQRSGHTVLLVDQDPAGLDLLELAFRSAGFHVARATSAEEAIGLACRLPPDCTLIDLGIPSWRALVAKLRGLNPFVRHYLVGAGLGSCTKEELALLGVARYFEQPFCLDEIFKALREKGS